MSASPEDGPRLLATSLAAAGLGGFEVALVLGSGLGVLAEAIDRRRSVPFADLEGALRSRVPGHAGRFSRGELAGVPVLVQEGRVHLYEGWSAAEVTRSVRAFARLGARAVVLTNAAGCLVPEWRTPLVMRVEDHLDFTGRAPLSRAEAGRGNPYDPGLGRVLERAAERAGVPLVRGVYAGVLGPAYETAAEIRFLARAGAHAVGMSTVCEALAARASGLRVAALACLTNPAAGLAPGVLEHEHVTRAASELGPLLAGLLTRALPDLARE